MSLDKRMLLQRRSSEPLMKSQIVVSHHMTSVMVGFDPHSRQRFPQSCRVRGSKPPHPQRSLSCVDYPPTYFSGVTGRHSFKVSGIVSANFAWPLFSHLQINRLQNVSMFVYNHPVCSLSGKDGMYKCQNMLKLVKILKYYNVKTRESIQFCGQCTCKLLGVEVLTSGVFKRPQYEPQRLH